MTFASRFKSLMSSGGPSGSTSNPIFIGDMDIIALSYETRTNSASTLTVQASGADGFTAAIPANTWSNLTAIASQGPQTIDPGLRWLRVVASESSVTVILSGQVNR